MVVRQLTTFIQMTATAALLYVCMLSTIACSDIEASETASPPNIVFILADDLGFRDVGFSGSTVIRTPTLDRLAFDGVRLDNYYVQPICSPTRSQLLSGRYQIHTGLQHASIGPCLPFGLPEEIPTLADRLRTAGYATHMVGKWHVGFYKEQLLPTRRGFDSFFGFLSGREDHYRHTLCDHLSRYFDDRSNEWDLSPADLYAMAIDDRVYCGYDRRSNETVSVNDSGHYSTHVFTRKAVDVITSHVENRETKPFFLYLSYQAVHNPLQVPEAYVKPYATSIDDNERRTYAGMTSCLDEGVLNVTTALEKHGLWNNTILIFSTDNGADADYGGNNWPLRGWKYSLWEGGLRGVAFVHSPLIARQSGTVNNDLMHVTDWFPTLLGLAGANTSGLDVDGFDVWSSISNGDPSPRTEILHNIDPLRLLRGSRLNISQFDNRVFAAIRVGDWKLITGNQFNGSWIAPPEDPTCQSISDPDPESKNIWLFDLSSDPEEKTDLFDLRQDIAVEMLNKLVYYEATAVSVRYPMPDPNCDPQLYGGAWGPWRGEARP